jgi:hypothetical protein
LLEKYRNLSDLILKEAAPYLIYDTASSRHAPPHQPTACPVPASPLPTHLRRRVAAAISRLGGEDMIAFGKVGRATAAIGHCIPHPHRAASRRNNVPRRVRPTPIP